MTAQQRLRLERELLASPAIMRTPWWALLGLCVYWRGRTWVFAGVDPAGEWVLACERDASRSSRHPRGLADEHAGLAWTAASVGVARHLITIRGETPVSDTPDDLVAQLHRLCTARGELVRSEDPA